MPCTKHYFNTHHTVSDNYCILITITRESISFRYNRSDGDNRFIDYAPGSDGVEMPFAVLCSAGQFVIGKTALESARTNQNPDAYADLFKTCRAKRTFRFANRDESLGKLPYYAIRCYIERILSDIFYNHFGSIESNVARMPLVFLFGPELDTNKRRFILAPFEEGGFQNLWHINYPDLLLPVVDAQTSPSDLQQAKATAIVTADEADLLIQLYSTQGHKPLGDAVRIEGKGIDPRLKQATDIIWGSLFSYNYKERDREEDILHDAAERFLNSGVPSVNDTLRMSDGSEQPYFINRSQLDTSMMAQVNRDIMYHLNNELSKRGLTSNQCRVVLTGKVATDYFEGVFRQSRWAVDVIKVTEKEKQLILDNLLTQVKKKNYYWGTEALIEPSGKTTQDNSQPHTDNLGNNDDTHEKGPKDPPIRFVRRVKITKREIEAQIEEGNLQAAQTKLDGLFRELHNAEVLDFDTELHKLEECIASAHSNTNTLKEVQTNATSFDFKEDKPKDKGTAAVGTQVLTSPATPSSPLPQSEITQREVRLRLAALRSAIKEDYDKALKEFRYLQGQSRLIDDERLSDKVADFEILFKDYKPTAVAQRKPASTTNSRSQQATIGGKQKSQSSDPTHPSGGNTPKELSSADRLFKQGKYHNAKTTYAQEGNSPMAALCTKLIKASGRLERAIRPELQSVVSAHNKDKARKYIDELKSMKALIEEAHLDADTTAITALIKDYGKA